jgi:cytosine/adenosine deaminase-related metal-dependent hydrolase
MFSRPVSFVNARVITERGEMRAVRFDRTVLGIDERPGPRDRVIDLDGAIVLPGLVNAHDHLELNHYGRLKFRERYTNVAGWIDDMRPRLEQDPRIAAGRKYSLADRLFMGVLKNLLAGVTTVAHHNPLYRELRRALPIRLVRRYGWAHSFDLEDAPAGARGESGGNVAERFRATPAHLPFFVHLAEGTDAAAQSELRRLDALGCLGPNVVLVHGVAIRPAEWLRIVSRGAGLVWCPGSNLFLFKQTAPIGQFITREGTLPRRIALGTDSRLSGARDLLEELKIAAGAGMVQPRELLSMVTDAASRLLRQQGSGRIHIGCPADFLVIPNSDRDAAVALLKTTRRDVSLVVVGGRALLGARVLAKAFAGRRTAPRSLVLDGALKLCDAALARRIQSCRIQEPGLEAA